MKILVIIPTLNEVGNINSLIEKIEKDQQSLVDILIVDDNSSDGTIKLIRILQNKYKNLFLLRRMSNPGLGRAYLAGFAWGLEHNYEVFIQMDADWSHNPLYLFQFIKSIRNTDFVIGSRYINGGKIENWKYFRKFISRIGNLYTRIILGTRIADFTGGFNAWRAEVLEKIGLDNVCSDGYSFQIELKYRAIKSGFNYLEIPIVFVERQAAESKMNLKIVWEALWRVPLLCVKTRFFRFNTKI